MNKMISQRSIKNIALATAVFWAGACVPEDDFQDIEVMAPSPALSLPLLNTNLRVDDLINTDNGGLLEQNPDGTYSIFYRQSIQTWPVGEFFPPIPAQQFMDRVSLGLSSPAFSLTMPEPIVVKGEIPLDFEGLTLYEIECKQGQLDVSVTSGYEHELHIKLVLPDILDAAQKPMVLDFDFPVWASKYSRELKDLTGYSLHINQDKIRYIMEVSIIGSGNAIDPSDEIELSLDMADIKFSYVAGNFSEMIVPMNADSLAIPFLANAVNGNLALNPKLNLDLSNSFGVPVSPDFSQIFVERKSGAMVQLQDEGDSQFFNGDFEFPYLKDRNELPAMKSQKVTRSNSNLEEAFAELPRGIDYLFGFKLNSAAEDTSFISDESSIGVDMEVELPLEGRFDIVLEDTIAVDLGFDQEIEELRVLIKTENGFPIDAQLQVFFLDEQGNKIFDSNGDPVRLFEDQAQLLKAAQIINSTTGETQSATIDMPISATIDAEKYALIKKAGSVLVQAGMQSNTQDDGLIRLYDSYNIRFSLAMQIKSSLNLSN